MTEATETTPAEGKKRRPRGAGFPAMSLPDAAAAITTIASMGKHLTKEEAASYLGHSTVKSGAFAVKYAALRDYGFLTGRGEDLEVGDLGMQVAHPESDSARAESLRQAFFRSDIFSSVFSSLRPGSELQKDHVASKAVHQFGVSASSKGNFIETFVESAAAAGLVEEIDDDRFQILEPAAEAEEESPAPSSVDLGQSLVQTDEANLPTPASVRKAGGQPPVVSHPWHLAAGEMLFQITVAGSLPATAYGKIQSIIEQGDELARLLGLADDSGQINEAPDEEVMT